MSRSTTKIAVLRRKLLLTIKAAKRVEHARKLDELQLDHCEFKLASRATELAEALADALDPDS